MKNVALVIAESMFRDEEYEIPRQILQNAGFTVQTVSTTTERAVGSLGLEVKPDILLKDLKAEEIDALIFIGGGGSEQYFHDPLAHRLAQEMVQLNKVLGAICIAPVILGRAQVLKGKNATVFPDGIGILVEEGANYTAAEVQIDGTIITGNGAEAAQAFGEALVQML